MNDAIKSAFNQLIVAARELHEKRGQCLGATLKVELGRRSSWSFNERLLGFARFGDFLRAAESAGLIQTRPTPGGDIQIIPVSAVTDTPRPTLLASQSPVSVLGVDTGTAGMWQTPGGIGSAVRVRQDLWNAFNSVHDDWVYDRGQDLAMRQSLAERTGGGSAGLVAIPPGRVLLMQWIGIFAEAQDSLKKQELLSMLEAEGAPLNFLLAARRDNALKRAWHRFHVQRVTDAINEWSAANHVHLNFLIRGAARRQMPSPTESPAAIAPRPSMRPEATSLLTEKLANAIDEVIEKLITLRGLLAVQNRQP